MDFLKKLFPYSFGTKEVSNLVVRTIIYALALIIGGVLIGIIGLITGLVQIPVVTDLIGILLGLLGGLVELYCVAGSVVMFLAHFKVLKD
jgi:hypothetical protein